MAEKISRLSVVINIEVEKGSTFRHTLVWTYAEEPYIPIDLTGCTALMQVRPDQDSDEILHEMTTENDGLVLGGTTGSIDMYISAADSTAWEWNDGVYSLEVTFPNTDVRRLARGVFISFNETTR